MFIHTYLLKFIKILLIHVSGIIYSLVLNNASSKHEFQTSNQREFQSVGSDESGHNMVLIQYLKKELASANYKIEQLQKKMQGFEDRIRKPYPNVKYLNYRSKKRILVCQNCCNLLIFKRNN